MPIFSWPRLATARSQVWLGLPNGGFQSGAEGVVSGSPQQWHGGDPLVGMTVKLLYSKLDNHQLDSTTNLTH